MSRIVVLGGGKQGQTIAADLASRHEVTVADARPLHLAGVRCVAADLSDRSATVRLIAAHDLAVGALPARLGFQAAQAAIEARRNFVDVAFFEEDPAVLEGPAKSARVVIVPDCGLAPGLSNLVVGRAVAGRKRDRICVEVGGVAEDPSRPYGYVVTWSVEDLQDEFVRPARIVRDGRVVTLPAMSELESVQIAGIGAMESFLTDGLRTLLTLDGVREMSEKTLRWPGHVDAIKPLLANGTFIPTMNGKCREGLDLVVFRVRVDGLEVLMTARGRPGLSAMSRTTALTTSSVAHWVAEGGLATPGVWPLERIARDAAAYRAIVGLLREKEILLQPAFPFID